MVKENFNNSKTQNIVKHPSVHKGRFILTKSDLFLVAKLTKKE